MTNAVPVNPKFSFNDGLFSGYDAQKHAGDKSSWSFQKDGKGLIKRDDTLKNPHCVFQLMKKHYDRYDLKKVSLDHGDARGGSAGRIRPSPPPAAGQGRDHIGAASPVPHSVAIAEHPHDDHRAALLGNIGICGGINALRGEPNVQGPPDHALLSHYLPGYPKAPGASWADAEQCIAGHHAPDGEPSPELDEQYRQVRHQPDAGSSQRRDA